MGMDQVRVFNTKAADILCNKYLLRGHEAFDRKI